MMMMMKDVRLVSKMEGKTNFQDTYTLSGNGIVEFEIIDVGRNLKQFDVEATENALFIFGREGKCRRK